MELTKRKMSWNKKVVFTSQTGSSWGGGGVGVQKYSNHHAGNIHMDFHLQKGWGGGGGGEVEGGEKKVAHKY